MADYRFVLVDVFTDTPLEGNQLCVFPDAREIPEDRLLPLAREVHFSETTFAYPPDDADADVRVRIFTPGVELGFAGHPVLGSAVVLARSDQDEIRLQTARGVVPVRLTRGEGPTFGRMQQPIPTVEPFPEAAGLLAALGVARSRFPVELYDNGVRHVYVALESPEAVAELQPDLLSIARAFPHVCVNCFAGTGDRWKTRMFSPSDGINEDPATGSAAGPLAVHLARHGAIGFGQEIHISQGVELARPSTLLARVDGSTEAIDRVEVGGHAIVVGRGEFELDRYGTDLDR